MKNQIAASIIIVAFLQGCAATGVHLGNYVSAKTLEDASMNVEKLADKYMALADKQQQHLDDSYTRNFALSFIAAGGAISSLHVSAIKGLAFLSGSSAVFSEQWPGGKRADALLAGAKTLQCMMEKIHAAGFALEDVKAATGEKAPPPTIESRKYFAARLTVSQADISKRVEAFVGPGYEAFWLASKLRQTTAEGQGKVVPRTTAGKATALAKKIDEDISPIATETAVTASLNDGANFVERQVRQRFLDNAKFDYKKIFADLKALADVSAQKDDAAETEAADQELPAGSGKAARQVVKSDPRRTVLKDIVACRENLI